jgi:hypothetical protein
MFGKLLNIQSIPLDDSGKGNGKIDEAIGQARIAGKGAEWKELQNSWTPPPQRWIKINTDAAYRPSMDAASAAVRSYI